MALGVLRGNVAGSAANVSTGDAPASASKSVLYVGLPIQGPAPYMGAQAISPKSALLTLAGLTVVGALLSAAPK